MTTDPEQSAQSPQFPVVLFDGDCGLCARSVQFILDHNRAGDIFFAPLQSPFATELCGPHGIDPTKLDTLVVITEDNAFRFSDSVIEISKRLDRPWRLATTLRFVPHVIRDAAYRFVAKHRLRIAPPLDSCRLPTAEERRRFLD